MVSLWILLSLVRSSFFVPALHWVLGILNAKPFPHWPEVRWPTIATWMRLRPSRPDQNRFIIISKVLFNNSCHLTSFYPTENNGAPRQVANYCNMDEIYVKLKMIVVIWRVLPRLKNNWDILWRNALCKDKIREIATTFPAKKNKKNLRATSG